jgi:hypothetical protein
LNMYYGDWLTLKIKIINHISISRIKSYWYHNGTESSYSTIVFEKATAAIMCTPLFCCFQPTISNLEA